MKELTFDVLLAKAIEFHKGGTNWHFHILMKNCEFNKNKEKFSVILENEESKEMFVAYFDENPKKDAEKIENLFYRGIY